MSNTITPPKGWKPPQTDNGNNEFDVVDTWRIEPDGKLRLVKLGDCNCDDEDEESESKPTNQPYSAMANDMASSAPNTSTM